MVHPLRSGKHLLAAMCFCAVQASAAEIVGSGIGAASCAVFAEDYSHDPAYYENSYFIWAQGYMTGLNVAVSANSQRILLSDEFDTVRQRAAIRRFCADNPLRWYWEAVVDLYNRLPRVN